MVIIYLKIAIQSKSISFFKKKKNQIYYFITSGKTTVDFGPQEATLPVSHQSIVQIYKSILQIHLKGVPLNCIYIFIYLVDFSEKLRLSSSLIYGQIWPGHFFFQTAGRKCNYNTYPCEKLFPLQIKAKFGAVSSLAAYWNLIFYELKEEKFPENFFSPQNKRLPPR